MNRQILPDDKSENPEQPLELSADTVYDIAFPENPGVSPLEKTPSQSAAPTATESDDTSSRHLPDKNIQASQVDRSGDQQSQTETTSDVEGGATTFGDPLVLADASGDGTTEYVFSETPPWTTYEYPNGNVVEILFPVEGTKIDLSLVDLLPVCNKKLIKLQAMCKQEPSNLSLASTRTLSSPDTTKSESTTTGSIFGRNPHTNNNSIGGLYDDYYIPFYNVGLVTPNFGSVLPPPRSEESPNVVPLPPSFVMLTVALLAGVIMARPRKSTTP